MGLARTGWSIVGVVVVLYVATVIFVLCRRRRVSLFPKKHTQLFRVLIFEFFFVETLTKDRKDLSLETSF